MAGPHHTHSDSLADERLLINITDGCTECFAALFHRYCRSVFSVSYRILRHRSETEDIVQEVFLAIFMQRERYDPARGSVKTWILQFAYFKALLRRRYLNIRNFYRVEEASEAREVRRVAPSELLGLSSAEWTRYVETGIATLNTKQRRIIELIHFEGYTLQEGSEILRETLANTRNYYYRGLKALRGFLEARTALSNAKTTTVLEGNGAYELER
jgi:RNA polymerase sigma-70 factor, ECF subfamily